MSGDEFVKGDNGMKETGKNGVMRACEDLLRAHKIRYWRMNAGDRLGSYQAKGGKVKRWRIRGHEKGTPDLLLGIKEIVSLVGDPIYGAYMVWIEAKGTDGHQTPEQKQFQQEAEDNGEIYLLIYEPDELATWLRERGL